MSVFYLHPLSYPFFLTNSNNTKTFRSRDSRAYLCVPMKFLIPTTLTDLFKTLLLPLTYDHVYPPRPLRIQTRHYVTTLLRSPLPSFSHAHKPLQPIATTISNFEQVKFAHCTDPHLPTIFWWEFYRKRMNGEWF